VRIHTRDNKIIIIIIIIIVTVSYIRNIVLAEEARLAAKLCTC
jgi:hypothetical protein